PAQRHQASSESGCQPLNYVAAMGGFDMTEAGESAKQPWYKRWGLWVGGIATTVVAALATTAASGGAASLWHHLTETSPGSEGPPVAVAAVNLGQCVRFCADTGDFVFPQNITFSSSDLRRVNKLLNYISGFNSYGEWMRAHGGVDVGHVDIQLAL